MTRTTDPAETATIADALAAGTAARTRHGERFFGIVRAVNPDGTLTVEAGIGWLASVRALTSYAPRAAGDTVLLVATAAGPLVQGTLGSPSGITVSDSDPPGGAGFFEVVSGAVWAKEGAAWYKRLPVTPGLGLTLTASHLATYRGGTLLYGSVAEAGDPDGAGTRTGLATFASFASLAGKTPTGGTLTVHRRNLAYGDPARTVITIYAAAASGIPASSPSAIGSAAVLVAAPNEAPTVPLTAAWAAPFVAGSATALLVVATRPEEVVALDAMTLTITTTT